MHRGGTDRSPQGGVLLTHTDRYPYLLVQFSQQLGIFAANRIFHEKRIKRFNASAKSNRLGRIEPGMNIDDHLDLRTHRFPDGGKFGDPVTDSRSWIEDFSIAGKVEADKFPAFGYFLQRIGHQLLGSLAIHMRVADDAIPAPGP